MTLTMSMDGACLQERQIQKLARLPKQLVRVLVVNAQPAMRYVSLVEVQQRHYWADRITGTLYHAQSGLCLSSQNLSLDMTSIDG